ncbi:MAG TPA: hypothetical protein VMU84_11560 [Thermoanaerobaculia bacterium]|nr:hypothetical protein [Thermoanaerobaculia bacterium]
MSELTGRWRNGEETIEFREDGTVVVRETHYLVQAEADRLFLFPVAATMVVPYRRDGDELTLEIDGDTSTWTLAGQ